MEDAAETERNLRMHRNALRYFLFSHSHSLSHSFPFLLFSVYSLLCAGATRIELAKCLLRDIETCSSLEIHHRARGMRD